MIRPLTADERDALIDRIAERIAAFDDASLQELDRVTDEAAYLDVASVMGPDAAVELDGLHDAGPGRPPGGAVGAEAAETPGSAPLSRRQLLGGGAVLVLASLGTALAVRGAWPGAGCP